MIDISQIATRLESAGEGLWRSREMSEISYSEAGNERCLQVEDSSFWFGFRNLLILEAIRRFPPSGALFDIGGGNGFVSLAIQEAGFEAVVVEPGPQGAMNAVRRGLRPVVNATLQDADFAPGSLPATGLFDVLEHIEGDTDFLQMLRRLMTPGGRLYLTVPAYRLLWSPEDDRAGHFRRYRLPELQNKLESVGFEVELQTYIFSVLILPIFLLRTIPGWLGLRNERDSERTRKEHGASKSGASGLLQRALRAEVQRLANGKSIPCGSSCLVVARSRSDS